MIGENNQEQIQLVASGGGLTNRPDISTQIEKSSSLRVNSEFSILVFYKPERKEDAQRIEQKLLVEGYRSSSTPTKLTEAKKQLSPGATWIIYTQRGRDKLGNVTSILGSLGMNEPAEVEIEPNPVNLRIGDIQLLLF